MFHIIQKMFCTVVVMMVAGSSLPIYAEFDGCPALKNISAEEQTQIYTIVNSLCVAAETSPRDHAALLNSLWSENGVNVTHEPVTDHEGVMPYDILVTGHNMEIDVYFELMPDYHLSNVDGNVVGSHFWLFYTQRGTLKDGTHVRSPRGIRFNVKSGKIIELLSTLDPEGSRALGTAMMKKISKIMKLKEISE